MILQPTVIAQILSSQASYIDRSYGQMFYYTDTNQLYYDTIDNNRILLTDCIVLQFEKDRTNYVPSRLTSYPGEFGQLSTSTNLLNYSYVYVIETNCLYKYENTVWTIIYGKYGVKNVAQTYTPNGTVTEIYPDDVSTNGILNDGSVVIRDNNKMICGILKSDGYTFNILSLIGGCINIDPSGTSYGNGCLQLNANLLNPTSSQLSEANLNSNLTVFGNIRQVPYTEWYKQYRLVTEDLIINSNSTIKAGSTLISGSNLGDVTYTEDTILSEDKTVVSGLILQNSKIYKDSIINNKLLEPPFLFDIQNMLNSTVNVSTNFDNSYLSIDGTKLVISNNSPFNNIGDVCYLQIGNLNISNITQIKFNNVTYDICYKATDGLINTVKLVFCFNNEVKVLP